MSEIDGTMSKRRKKRTEKPAVPPPPRSAAANAAEARSFPIRPAMVSLALVVLTAAVYGAVGRSEFVSFDDPQYVSQNVHVQAGLSWAGVRWALTTGEAGNWHPLAWISHMLDVQLFGMSSGAHHVTSLVFHVANTLLLLGLLVSTTGAVGRSAFVAALFAVHPLHVESVAWVSERKDVLSTFFWMLSLLAYVQYVRSAKWASYAPVVGFLILGLMSKPMVVTLPCTLLLLDYWPLQRRFTKRLILEKVPLFGIVAASSVVTFLAQRHSGAVSALAALPLGERVANAIVAYLAYIEKMIWPARLTNLYPYAHHFDWRLGAATAVLAGVTFASLRWARRFRYLPVGWFWFAGTLVPVIGLVQVGIQSMADRYTYVPSIGLFIIAAWGAVDLCRRFSVPLAAPVAAGSLAVGICAIVAHDQVRYWHDSLSLWEHADRVTPREPHVETALGSVLDEKGDRARAIALYADAIAAEPGFAEAHNKLGVALANTGRIGEAIPHYQTAIQLKPSLAEAWYNLGNALAAQGNFDDAIARYHQALLLRPDDPAAHNGLGSALDDEGRADDAVREYESALTLNPNFADAHNNLGTLRAKQGRPDDAIHEFLEALRINPNQADAHYNVAVMLNAKGRTAEALAHLHEALRLNPNHAGARQALQVIGVRAPE